jgi:xanthine/CO dehydrogenase XdhC/CoxF family maturation factor
MKELQEILRETDQLKPDEKAVLATVVSVEGSSYRLPGARMLITPEGQTFGTISGGCLESDVLERAKRVLATDKPSVFCYDTTGNETSVFTLNMGCRGIVRLLLEPVFRNSTIVNVLRQVDTQRQKYVIATVLADHTDGVQTGGRMVCSESGEFIVDDIPSELPVADSVRQDCESLLRNSGEYSFKSYEVGDAAFEFSFETIKPSVALMIFGAGADACPLAKIAHNLGWDAYVADHRPAYLTSERFPYARELFKQTAEDTSVQFEPDSMTAAVIMTHNYARDREILSALLKTDAFYIGALGPKRRTGQLLSELRERRESIDPDSLQRLFAPIGLDIGADTPEAIAVAIAAEIQSVLKNREGGFLRQRNAPIYDRKA